MGTLWICVTHGVRHVFIDSLCPTAHFLSARRVTASGRATEAGIRRLPGKTTRGKGKVGTSRHGTHGSIRENERGTSTRTFRTQANRVSAPRKRRTLSHAY